MYCRIIIYCLLFYLPLSAQDHAWWADNVQWDGITNWSEYIITSPGSMGPNALPIPDQNWGKLADKHSLSLGLKAWTMPGDQTYNLNLKALYLMVPERISFGLSWVPIEYFQMSHELKTERNVFHIFYDEQTATGDIILNTNIQLLRDEQHFADGVIQIGYRFPTSNKQGAARFTDAPGYYFDLGLSKSWGSAPATQWQLAGMLGFYVYQTNRDDQFQNDAFLFGLGLKMLRPKWQLSSNFRGYTGYLYADDFPMVVDVRLEHSIGKFPFFLKAELGLQDRLYDAIEAGALFYWE